MCPSAPGLPSLNFHKTTLLTEAGIKDTYYCAQLYLLLFGGFFFLFFGGGGERKRFPDGKVV